MVEWEWLNATSPLAMLGHLRHQASERKFRLFASACFRLWQGDYDVACLGLLSLSDRLADGLATDTDVADRRAWLRDWMSHSRGFGFTEVIFETLTVPPFQAAISVAHFFDQYRLRDTGAAEQEQRKRCRLVQHIFANPFRPLASSTTWPPLVTQLAASIYEGADPSFVLQDALVDAGHDELAAHFREEPWHPKGCWVVDLILGNH